MARIYRGDPPHLVLVADVPDGTSAEAAKRIAERRSGGWRALPHFVRHSPTGFSWGYGGSGPSDLARCLLIDHLGAVPWVSCAKCWTSFEGPPFAGRPTARTPEADEKCPECGSLERLVAAHDSIELPVDYHAFKSEVVAEWPGDQPWVLTSTEIDEWLLSKGVRRDG